VCAQQESSESFLFLKAAFGLKVEVSVSEDEDKAKRATVVG
jgi:hypothetical protein